MYKITLEKQTKCKSSDTTGKLSDTSSELSYKWKLNIVKKEKKPKQLVLFIQALQGSGKSTIAELVCQKARSEENDWKYIEQDQFNGDTKKCQEALKQLLKAGTEVIIISRCNMNLQHYKNYLELVLKYCHAVFINFSDTNGKMKTKLTLARSIAGILNRSTSTDKVVFGSDTILLEDAVKYTSTNMKFWSPHPQAVLLPVLNHDKELSVMANTADDIIEFSKAHHEELMSLSRPLETIVMDFYQVIRNIPKENYVTPKTFKSQLLQKAVFTSFELQKTNKKVLKTFLKKNVVCSSDKLIKCEHVTQYFKSKKDSCDIDLLSFPNDTAVITIDCLVKNNSSGMSAFHVSSIKYLNGADVYIHSKCPHITAFVPEGYSPKDSLEFVSKRDSSVTIFPYKECFKVKCKYHTRR